MVRLHFLLTVKESAVNVPTNLDARRRITFFANSLFMKMPRAPKVRDMISFRSVIVEHLFTEILKLISLERKILCIIFMMLLY